MVSETQAAHVMALVRERHGAVRKDFDNLLDAIARVKQDRITAANQRLVHSLQALKDAVAAEHWPDWLRDLLHHCQLYQTNHTNGIGTWIAHLRSLIKNYSHIEAETWTFDAEEDLLFDVDGILDRARAEHRINELFSNVIAALHALADCDELDSMKACSDLRRLIANLEKARNGSFTSQVCNWQFARRLVPNIISAYVKRSSITGPLIEGFEQTAAELDVSLANAKDQIGEEILKAAASSMRTDCSTQIESASLLYLEDGRVSRSRSNRPARASAAAEASGESLIQIKN